MFDDPFESPLTYLEEVSLVLHLCFLPDEVFGTAIANGDSSTLAYAASLAVNAVLLLASWFRVHHMEFGP